MEICIVLVMQMDMAEMQDFLIYGLFYSRKIKVIESAILAHTKNAQLFVLDQDGTKLKMIELGKRK